MNKKIITLCFLLLSIAVAAQNVNSKYLKGAVPEVDGRVVFERTIKTKNTITDDKLFVLVSEWAQANYGKDAQSKNRVLLSNNDTKNIACMGEKEMVFKSSALSIDRTYMSYQLILEIKNGTCEATVRNIKYLYPDSDKDVVYSAEETITDKLALSKDGAKLNRFYNKFRTHTVDSITGLFDSIDIYLNGKESTQGAAHVVENAPRIQPMSKIVTPMPMPVPAPIAEVEQTRATTGANALAGYKSIEASKIPGNIIKLMNDWVLITSGKSKVNTMTASWGGLGMLWEQPIAFSFLNPTRYSVETMDEGDTYTISFYTEAYKDVLKYCGSHTGKATDKIKESGLTPIITPSGAIAFSEAWMIFECKKILKQPISSDAVVDKEVAKKWSKDGYHNMYVGQILNVWIK